MKLGNGITEKIAKAMWDRTHDGSWGDVGDGQDESRAIYREDAKTAVAVIKTALKTADREQGE